MFERVKKWFAENKKEVVATAIILAVTGMFVTVLVNGKIVNIPIDELTKRMIPEKKNAPITKTIPAAAQEVMKQQIDDEMISLDVDDVTKVFPRSEFIRRLHKGWHPSEAKIAEAAARGISLKPGETIVKPCMVTMKTNGII